MKAEFKINVAAILIIVIGVAFFFWFNGKKNREIDVYLNTLAEYEWQMEQEQSKIDSAIITWQETLNASDEALRAALSNDSIQEELIAHYKRLASIVKVETVYVHDTVKVSVPIYIENDTTVNLSDNCFEASLSLFNGGFSLDNYSIVNRQDIVIGDARRSLKGTESYIAIRNTNPCITTTGVQSYTIVTERKWWENPLITVPASVLVGYTVGRIQK